MNSIEVNKYIVEEMEIAEKDGDNAIIRLYLSNDDSIDIWFDEDCGYYTWSNASYGYEDTYSIVNDIFEWLKGNSLCINEIKTI